MKRFLLGLLCVMSLCGCVKAANPSFSSFATNHFITNNFLIRARLNPAQFDTNASAITITITNVAGVPGGGTLWTNSAGVLQPLGHINGTNQFTIAEATGWTGSGTNAFFDDGTFSGVAVINPTDGYLPYRANAYELGDSPWRTNNVNLLEAVYNGTNVLAIGNDGTLMPGVASAAYYGSSPSLALGFFNDTDTGGAGTFELTLGGGSASGTRQAYVDIAGDNKSAQVAANTYLDNGDTVFSAFSSSTNEVTGIQSGWNSTNLVAFLPFWPDQLNIAAHTLDTSIPYSQGYLFALKNNQTNRLSFGPNAKILFHGFDDLSTTNYSRLAISHTGTNGAVVLDSQSAGTAGSPRGFVFKGGGTNLVHVDLTISGYPLLTVTNAISGQSTTLHVNPGGEGQWSSSSGFLRAYGTLITQGNVITPAADNTTDIGSSSSSGAYKDLWMKGSHYIEGYNNGSGNESWMQVQHTGATNGVIEFISHATIGGARPFRFNGADVILGNSHTPASSSETNYVGAMTWDSNYIYVWTATNVNKRATLNAW